jgi:hypothetical protein
MTENLVSSCFIGWFSKSNLEGAGANQSSAHRYRPGELLLVFSCFEISDRAKYVRWNDLHDLDDLHDLLTTPTFLFVPLFDADPIVVGLSY